MMVPVGVFTFFLLTLCVAAVFSLTIDPLQREEALMCIKKRARTPLQSVAQLLINYARSFVFSLSLPLSHTLSSFQLIELFI